MYNVVVNPAIIFAKFDFCCLLRMNVFFKPQQAAGRSSQANKRF